MKAADKKNVKAGVIELIRTALNGATLPISGGAVTAIGPVKGGSFDCVVNLPDQKGGKPQPITLRLSVAEDR